MIHCKLHGRLGNNLFTIATGLSLAKKLNTNLTTDKVTSAGHRGIIPVDLSIFDYKFNQIDTPDLSNTYNEVDSHYVPINVQDNTILSGLFGSWRYFEDIKKEIQTQYFIPSEKIFNNLKKYNTSSNSLGICVRRGDFLMLQNSSNTQPPKKP